MEYQIILGIISVLIGLAGYVTYFKEFLFGKIKPHSFTWLIWGVLNAIVFFASLSSGGGAGAWAVAASGALNFVIFGIAIFKGEKEITYMDKVCLVSAFLGIGLWAITSNPLWSVILITVVDLVGYIPTYRKTYKKPDEESLAIFVFSTVSYFISLFALQAVNVVTFLYPATMVVSDTLFVILVLHRRSTVAKHKRISRK